MIGAAPSRPQYRSSARFRATGLDGYAGAMKVAAVVTALWIAASSQPVAAQLVSEQNGNIVFTDPAGHRVQITDSGRDFAPSLSPNGAIVVYARHTPDDLVHTGIGDVEAGEIWVVGTDGSHAKRLARGAELKPWEDTLAGLTRPEFLSDSRRVVFQSDLWATSGKVNLVDVNTGQVRRVAPGSLDTVILRGEYRDHLIINQHRYFLGAGSYDWWWLFDAAGKEIGPVGSDEAQVEMFQELYVPGYKRRPAAGS